MQTMSSESANSVDSLVNSTEDFQSEADRVNYLREKGIQIEFPEDRKTPKLTQIAPENIETITVVRIPSNDSEPYEEIRVEIDRSKRGDQLISALARYFQGDASNSIDGKAVAEAAAKQFSTQDIKISQETIFNMQKMGAVEVFPLSRPCATNKQSGVNLYLDEIGQFKSLRPNRRATSLANSCAYDNVPLVGDMYVGRIVQDSFGDVRNVSFSLRDLSSDASWLQTVQRENYDFGIKTNRVTFENPADAVHEEESTSEKPYKWSETEDVVDVTYDFDRPITSKDIIVEIKQRSMRVIAKANKTEVFFQIDLWKSIRPDETTWTLNKGKLEISAEKVESEFWRQISTN